MAGIAWTRRWRRKQKYGRKNLEIYELVIDTLVFQLLKESFDDNDSTSMRAGAARFFSFNKVSKYYIRIRDLVKMNFKDNRQ